MKIHFGIIGYPLSHSFSPKYFTEKFKHLKLNHLSYKPYPIENLENLMTLITDHKLQAFNITIPYKEKILNFLTTTTNAVEEVKACNCVVLDNNKKLKGFNTDIVGFEKSLLPLLKKHHSNALILGSGGAAKAVAFVLKKLNISFEFVSRSDKNALKYNDINTQNISNYSIIINTTPLGMSPNIYDCPSLPYQGLTEKHLCYDLIYNPTETIFLQKAKQQKATIKNGYEMLILQAEESWDIWKQHFNL